MPLIHVNDMQQHANRHAYRLCGVAVTDLGTLRAALTIASDASAPLLLIVDEADGADLELLLPAIEAAARRSTLPLAILFDAARSVDTVYEAIRLGCNAVRSAPDQPLAAELVDLEARCGVTVMTAADVLLRCTLNDLAQQLRADGSSGQAGAVLAGATRWQPVEHLIIFNVSGIDDSQALAMMTEGQRVLSRIPGVRAVVTGVAIKADAAYRFCWLVRFCHPAVIASYRDHPDHVAFADTYFRPVAGNRISIDYQHLDLHAARDGD